MRTLPILISMRLKKLKFDEPHRFKKKGNEDQYRFNLKVGDAIEEAKEACSSAPSQQLDKVHASLEKGEKLLSERQKHILLADKSDFGWSLIREYKSNDLAEDSDDEKKIIRAEAKARTQAKQNSARNKTRLASNRKELSVLLPTESATFRQFSTVIVQDPFQRFRPANRPNRDPVLLVTSQDIGGHIVLSILPSFSLLNN